MRYIFTVFILLGVTLFARDNPFEALATSMTTGEATYKKDTRENFSSTKLKLPSSARILKSVELHYQNLDGSLQSEKVQVDQKIDWHDELIVKKLTDDIIPTTAPTSLPKKMEFKKNKTINFKNIIFFTIEDKSLHVKTKDKKIRDFLVTNPYKIVIDFNNEVSFYTKIYNLKTKFFSSITLGKHNGYYRVAIELDGKYIYNKQEVKDGYLFTLK